MYKFKQFFYFILISGLVSGLVLMEAGLNPFKILVLVLLAILPALLIPHLLITGVSKPEGVRL